MIQLYTVLLHSAFEICQLLATCTYEFLITMLKLETFNLCGKHQDIF